MGLIKLAAETLGALGNAVNTTGESLWVDYFESGDMSGGVIMKRGTKIGSKGSMNKGGDQNIISSGSGIDVQENQCMILVENGRIVDFCAEPGRYQFDASTAPSLMSGNNSGLKAILSSVGNQFLAGGSRTNTQRVYYINLGEIQGFKWGSGNIVFDHWESDIQTGQPVWHIATTLMGNGVYSIHVTDPAKFFQVIGSQKTGGDNGGLVTKTDIEAQIKTEAIAAIRQAVGQLAKLRIPYTDIASNEAQLTEEVNEILSRSWGEARGIAIFKIAIGMMDADENSKAKIEKYQETRGYTDPSMLGAYMGMGQTQAMQAAGANPNGAMAGFAGINMMGGVAGGANISNLMQQGQAAQQQPVQQAPQGDSWTCPSCGTANAGKFCMNCGTKRPEQTAAAFCPNCGQPIDRAAAPKFCPNCGQKLG
ncbi:MAG: SPFH domain-containing protein [Lachnospiraceae bacterium]|nr:SPFH domain-containing protein [Lachnospiraceae bacterium]